MRSRPTHVLLLALRCLVLTAICVGSAHGEEPVKSEGLVYKEAQFSTAPGTFVRINVDRIFDYHTIGIVCSQEDWKILLKNKEQIECWIREGKHMKLMPMENMGDGLNFIDTIPDAHALGYLHSQEKSAQVYVMIPKEIMTQLKDTRSVVIVKSPVQTKAPDFILKWRDWW